MAVTAPDIRNDPPDNHGFRYITKDSAEIWWRPYFNGFSVKTEPDGESKYIGNWATVQMLLNGEVKWEELG